MVTVYTMCCNIKTSDSNLHSVFLFLTILTTDVECCRMQHSTVSLCSGDGCCWLHADTELFLLALDGREWLTSFSDRFTR